MEIDTTLDQLVLKLENASTLRAKEKLVRDFAGQNKSPIIESGRAVFFYISKDAQKVALEGDWTGWQPTALLAYLPDTPLWYRVENFPKDARLEYRIVVNGHPRLDPRNPQVAISGFGSHSEFAMPGYRLPKEMIDHTPFQRGTVEHHWIKSQWLDDRRSFWINLPPRYDHVKRYPVVYFNDGEEYLYYGDLPRIIDYLIEHRRVPPFIAVMTRPNNREREYGLNDQYVRFVSDELVPWMDDCYPTIAHRSSRGLFGVSQGAVSAAHIAFSRPDLFGQVLGQSGNFSYRNDAVIQNYARRENLHIRFHLIVGRYETVMNRDDNAKDGYLQSQRRFVDVLRDKGYTVSYAEYPEGHQWGLWRAHIGDALQFFCGQQKN